MKKQKNFIGTHYPDGKGGYRFAGQPRDRKGKYSRKFKGRISTIILLSLFLVGVIAVAVNVFSREKIVEIDEPILIDNLPVKIAEFKADLLDTLKTCESNGYTEDDAPMILDTNKQFSLGAYMFQIKTVQHYVKTLYAKDITRKEAVLLALDQDQATQLASDIIFKTPNANKEWVNCFRKHNLQKDLDIIHKLEK